MGWIAAIAASWWSEAPTSLQAGNPVPVLETRAKEREAAGDPEGAMELLLAMHRASPSSGAVQLAHELSMRHPGAFAAKGCPVHVSSKLPTVVSMSAVDTETEEEQLALGLPSEADAVLDSRDGANEADATANNDRTQELRNSRPGLFDTDTREEGAVANSTAKDDEGETPWERGWQGPKGFKPPSSASSTNKRGGAHVVPADGRGLKVSSSSSDGADFPQGLRNFTVAQLNAFDGGQSPPTKRGGTVVARKPRPIYVAVRGNVYDASAGRDLYGPGGKYSEFAGHDVSRRVARGVGGQAAKYLEKFDDLSLDGLERFEIMTLDGWESTFVARGYPIIGRVVTPSTPRKMLREELRPFDGRGLEAGAMPRGYGTPPIYMGVKDYVFDVSFGGSEFYLDGGAYECLAGRDASRVLAKMSMEREDVEGVLDYSCLTERETKNIDDWVDKLGEGGKGYPVVGWIETHRA